jgi:hypothetical protein
MQYPEILEIEFLPEDFMGKYLSNEDCAVARAAKRALGKEVTCGGDVFTTWTGDVWKSKREQTYELKDFHQPGLEGGDDKEGFSFDWFLQSQDSAAMGTFRPFSIAFVRSHAPQETPVIFTS